MKRLKCSHFGKRLHPTPIKNHRKQFHWKSQFYHPDQHGATGMTCHHPLHSARTWKNNLHAGLTHTSFCLSQFFPQLSNGITSIGIMGPPFQHHHYPQLLVVAGTHRHHHTRILMTVDELLFCWVWIDCSGLNSCLLRFWSLFQG